MLQNAYLLAKIGADTAENEQHFAEILPKLATTAPSFLREPAQLTTVVLGPEIVLTGAVRMDLCLS